MTNGRYLTKQDDIIPCHVFGQTFSARDRESITEELNVF